MKSKNMIDNGEYEKARHFINQIEIDGSYDIELNERIILCSQLGIIAWMNGDPIQAKIHYDNLRSYAKKINDQKSREIANQVLVIIELFDKGRDLRSMGDLPESSKSFQGAICISRSIGKPEFEMKCLRQLSANHYALNQYEEFYRCNIAALQIAQSIKSTKDTGMCLNNLGIYYYRIEKYLKAIDFFEKSLQIAKITDNRRGESECLTNIGLVFSDMGNLDESVRAFEKSLAIDRDMKNDEYVAVDISNIGTVYRRKWIESNNSEDLERAYDLLKECFNHKSINNNDYVQVRFANNIGTILFDLKKYEEAREYFDKALLLAQKIEDKEGISNSNCNIGRVIVEIGIVDVALDYFQKAISLAEEIKAGHILWEAYLESADVLKKKGRYPEALKFYQDAIDTIEKSRSSIEDEDLKTGFLRSNRRLEAYHKAIDLLFLMNETGSKARYIDLAFQYSERAKARGFLDRLEVGRVAAAAVADPETESRAAEITARLSRLSRVLLTTEKSSGKNAEAEKELREAESDFDRLRREVRARDPVYSRLRFPEIASLGDLSKRKILDRETVVFTYAIGKDSSFGLALSLGKAKLFRLPPVETLRELVSGQLKWISDPDKPHLETAAELYRLLLAPGLDRPYRRLIIVPDDILHYLPFETIGPSGPASWAGREADVSYAPSLSSLVEITKRSEERRPASRDVLAVAASDGLAFAEREADDIGRFFPAGKSLILKGESAVEERLKTVPFSDFRVIHIAAHSRIDEQHPLRSGLVVSSDRDSAEDGLVQAREILDLRLNADLVVLSACRSAAGRLVRGEGLESLTRSFLFAGASSVVTSLWPVDDEATGRLMGLFYARLDEGRSIDTALRLAKSELSASAAFSHPYYWSGFVVSGAAGRRLRRTPWGIYWAAGAAVLLAVFLVLSRAKFRFRPVRKRSGRTGLF